MPPPFDWQGHRGCRGLMPENTIAGFIHALTFDQITTLEMDVVITKDSQVVLSHEPWMSEEICTLAGVEESGLPQVETIPYPGEDSTMLIPIMGLSLAQVQQIDCGLKPHPRFPDQEKLAAVKPSFAQLIAGLPLCSPDKPYGYNIELKYTPDWEAAGLVPDIPTFCKLVLQAIEPLRNQGVAVSLQCFHPPLLAELRQQDKDISLVYLDEFPERGDLAAKFAEIDLVPQVYSPYYVNLRPAEVQKAQNLGCKVIPWTVNTTEEMQALVNMGVDGIITDYLNRIPLE
ncbi:MAG: glycerophosphodiester phosphodiesterase family protein [Bacteroidota bacterium]